MRLNLRNVPHSLIIEIDQQLERANRQNGKKISRSQYIIQILSDVFRQGESSPAKKTTVQLEELTKLIQEHLTTEKLLIAILGNSSIQVEKETRNDS